MSIMLVYYMYVLVVVPLLNHCGKTLVPGQDAPTRGVLYIDGKGNSTASDCKVTMNTINDNQQIYFRLMVCSTCTKYFTSEQQGSYCMFAM